MSLKRNLEGSLSCYFGSLMQIVLEGNIINEMLHLLPGVHAFEFFTSYYSPVPFLEPMLLR